MTEVLLVLIGLVLIGLPLLAVAADRILPPPRRRAPPAPDNRDQLVRRFRLTWQDALEVEAAVREGRATRPDLQPAACGFAGLALAPPMFRGRPVTSYSAATRRAVLVAGAGAVVVFVVYAVALGSEVGLVYVVIYGVGIAFAIVARRRRRRAAAAALVADAATPTPG